MSKRVRFPVVKPVALIRALERAGFALHHTSGSHCILRHSERRSRVTVPFHHHDLKRGTLRAILRQAALSVEELIELL